MTHLNGESPVQQAVRDTVTLFVSVGGALVAVVRDASWELPFSWECRGCKEASGYRFERAWEAKASAQEHAEVCRAVPRTAAASAPASAGDRLVAEAVRELTATLSSVLGELGARVTDAERILSEDLGELRSELTTEASELCTEVAEARAAGVAELRDIAEALTVLVDRPRWWQWRRRAHRRLAAAETGTVQATETAEGVSA